jgi:hypothetical protein
MLTASAFPLFSTAPPQIYRQYFTAEERKFLDSSPLETALSEITVLRILLLRLLAASRRKAPLSLKRQLAMLGAFSSAGLILASLVRFHNRYFEPRHSLLDLLADMDPDDL